MTEEEFTFALLGEFRGWDAQVILQALHEFGYVHHFFPESNINYYCDLFWVSKEFTINKQCRIGDCVDMDFIRCSI